VITVEVLGKKEFEQYIETYTEEKVQGIKDVVNESGINVQAGSKKRAPVGVSGYLRSMIHLNMQDAGLTAEVIAAAMYSEYIENGTGPAAGHKRYMPPPGVLLDWMKKKGIPEDKEFMIRWKIYQKGTKPQPFMKPSWEEEKPNFERNLRKVLST